MLKSSFFLSRLTLSKLSIQLLPAERCFTMSSSDKSDDDVSLSGLSDLDPREVARVGTLEQYLERLHFLEVRREIDREARLLEDESLEGIAMYMKTEKCKNIITMAGAGISTSAGIPDFRSPVLGLYNNLQKYDVPQPQAIFDINFFTQNPQPFFQLAKELFPGSYKPTPAHYFIRLLHEKGLLLRHYTQNIDTLERVSGLPEEKLVEAHGTFHTSHCMDCNDEYSIEWLKEQVFSDTIPHCNSCTGIVKPDVTFFGESLPTLFHDSIWKDFPKCNLLIIMGSSLQVQPFATLVDIPRSCPRLIINREPINNRYSGIFDPNNITVLGDCDETVRKLADLMGWREDLEALIEEGQREDAPK